MRISLRLALLPLSLSLLCGLVGMPGAAAQSTWVGTASGNWSVATNWSPAVSPASGSSTAIIFSTQGDTLTQIATNDLGNLFQLNTITSQGTSAGAITIISASGSSIQFAGSNAGLIQNGAQSISFGTTNGSTLDLNAAAISVTGTGVGAVNFNSVITGSNSITVNYPQANQIFGKVSFSGANTSWSGGLIATNSNITISNSTSLGTGPLTIGGGSLSLSLQITNSIILTGTLTTFTSGGQFSGAISEASPSAPAQGISVQTINTNLAQIFDATNTYRGPTILQAMPILTTGGAQTPQMTVQGANGALLNTSLIQISDGGTFTLNNQTSTSMQVSNRLGTSHVPVTIQSGTFAVLGSNTAGIAAAAITEIIGTLTIGGGGTLNVGMTTISLNSNSWTYASAPAVTLNATSIVRQNNAVVGFAAGSRGTGGLGVNLPGLGQAGGPGAAQIFFSDATGLTNSMVGGGGMAGSTTISIIPWAFGSASPSAAATELVTYGATGVRPLDFSATSNEYATAIMNGADTFNNVRIYNANLSNTFTSGTKINALVVQGSVTTQTATGTLVIKSGAFVSAISAGTYASGLTLDFNGQEAVVNAASPFTYNGTFQNYSAFTKAGIGVLTFSSSTSALTGLLTLNGGQISTPDITKLNSVSSISVNGTGMCLGINNTVSDTGVTYNGSTAAALTPNIAVNYGGVFLRSNTVSTTLTVSGQITGNGGVIINSGTSAAGNVALTNLSNSYTGQTIVGYGTLQIAGDGALGASNGGAVVLGTGATLQLLGNWTTSRTVYMQAAATIDTNGYNASLSNPIAGTAFTKIGNGTLTLNAPTQLIGTLTVNGGTLLLGNGTNGTATGLSTVVVGASGTIGGNGLIGGNGSAANGLLVNGRLAPGSASGTGTLTVTDDVNIATGAIWRFQITGGTPASAGSGGSSGGSIPAPANNAFLDQGTIATTLTLAAPANTSFEIDGIGASLNPANSYSFAVARAGTVSGLSTPITNGSQFTYLGSLSSSSWNATLETSNGIVYLDLVPTAAPEPAWLVAASLLFIALLRRFA